MKRTYHQLLLTFLALLLCLAACSADQLGSSAASGSAEAGVTLKFTPTDDATVRARQPEQSFGREPKLEVDGESRKDILLRFDVSGVGASSVRRATLRLFAADPSPVGGEVFVTDARWRESDITWGAAPQSGASLGTLGAVTVETWYELDVTPLVSGDGPVALKLRSEHVNGADYASKEHTNGNAPELIVTLAKPSGGDGEAPRPPGDLKAVLVEADRVGLTWQTETSSVRGISYDIYRDDALLALVDAVTTYRDDSVVPGTTYRYAVRARDAVGNVSRFSTLDVSTPAADAPTTPDPDTATATLAAAGDFGGEDQRAGTVMEDLKTRNAAAFVLLGDVTYSERSAQAWCDWVHGYLGDDYALELLTGNHEDDKKRDGFIRDFTACMPDRLGSALGPGGYGVNYAFDLGPATVIATAPDVTVDGVAYRYDVGSPEQKWLLKTISAAKVEGDWVVVGMHKNCITIGKKSCEIGEAFAQLLIDKGVDLVLQGHEHNYQRSHALLELRSGSVPAGAISDDGTDGIYRAGAGTVFVIVGTAGRSLYTCSHTDPEHPYFAEHHCAEESDSTKGYLLLEASATSLEARFIPTVGSYSDAFTIRR